MEQKPPTIFINPKFKNAHINPNFLKASNKIHVNPKFLQISQNLVPAPPPELPAEILPPEPQEPAISNAIIRNTRRTLIRAPAARSTTLSQLRDQSDNKMPVQPPHRLIKINKNKLVTAAHLMKCQQKENEIIKQTTESIIKSKKLKRKTDMKQSIYKLDRRADSIPKKKKMIVSKYSLRRIDSISPKKIVRKSGQTSVNINGVLYKSTSNKLERSLSNSTEKLLVIRGEKFILDSSGTKLKLEANDQRNLKLSRIDIGGLTYKASQSGSFERDNSHQVRSHLSLAKTKSISLLARNRFQKSNIICPIYRRIGKCLAYANGRCQKVHDQRYVIVCPKFIMGSCEDDKCLLSHNANLHKMPVCTFFLQGNCNRKGDCLFLHKKLTDKTKLCGEFLKGYCPLADKCNLLHAFPATEKREKKNFVVVHHKKLKGKTPTEDAPAQNFRYNVGDSAQSSSVPKRGKIGALPSFIPL